MKVFFLILNPLWSPHFETELELISKHVEAGDDVFVLTDDGSLKCTVSNTENSFEKKIIARSKFRNGIRVINFNKQKILKLKKRPDNEKCLPLSFANFDDLKKFNAFGVDFGLGVISTIVSLVRDYRFNPEEYKDLVYRALWSSLLVYESVVDVIKKYHPSCFYMFNGRFAELFPAVIACNQNKIDFYLHERGCDINHYVVCKNSFLHDLDFLKSDLNSILDITKDVDKINISKKWFFDRRHGVDQAWFSYVKNQKKEKLPDGFNFNKQNVAIFNSSLDEYESFDEWRPRFYENEIIGLKKIFDSYKNFENIFFYLRIHPNLKGLKTTQIKELQELNVYNNVKFLWPDDSVDSYALLDACTKVLTFTSTMGVEACFWGKPSILAGRASYENLDCCYIPKNHEEVCNLILKQLEPKSILGALKYGYWQATRGVPFKFFKGDGFFGGVFLNEKISGKLSKTDRFFLKINKIKEAFKI